MRMLIHQGANDTDIRRTAERGGMVNMRPMPSAGSSPASHPKKKLSG